MIRITNVQADDSHRDILIVFDELRLVETVDSYYLAIDHAFMPGMSGDLKVTLVLEKLIARWHEFVLELGTGDVVYLPVDFSDQYLGCFRVERLTSGYVLVSYGFTTAITGHHISPSDIPRLKLSDEDYKVASAIIEFDKDVLVDYIQQALL
ncbi:hypothetical protein MKQ68_10790 [Chitinophaga horti]|uniref:Uncharacterized protein n=1 Tax=Chitinophaga horti TaxID=2920382 RepID=A0ABY6JAK2_9BACT|nr:hypothetical protein [Chitinophaga horti]UYQ95587.1 hypothetical protein MKQ68_10790 [Chitinophaga horti]